MIYQRHMPREELFSAQLEMLMQNGRLATVVSHLIGVGATLVLWKQQEKATCPQHLHTRKDTKHITQCCGRGAALQCKASSCHFCKSPKQLHTSPAI